MRLATDVTFGARKAVSIQFIAVRIAIGRRLANLIPLLPGRAAYSTYAQV